MDIEKIEKLINLMKSSGLEELEIEENKERLHLKLPSLVSSNYSLPFSSPVLREPSPSIQNLPQRSPLAENNAHSLEKGEQTNIKKKVKEIRSPFVGTFYAAPAPGAENFVEQGQRISKGDKLCIVEAMKLMNEIESDCDGVIVDVLIKNEQPVEYDQVLFLVE